MRRERASLPGLSVLVLARLHDQLYQRIGLDSGIEPGTTIRQPG